MQIDVGMTANQKQLLEEIEVTMNHWLENCTGEEFWKALREAEESDTFGLKALGLEGKLMPEIGQEETL